MRRLGPRPRSAGLGRRGVDHDRLRRGDVDQWLCRRRRSATATSTCAGSRWCWDGSGCCSRGSRTPCTTSPARSAPSMPWAIAQGPYSPALIHALARAPARPTLFSPYLFHPTLFGIAAAPHPRILVPAAHDEPALRLGIVRRALLAADGLWFHSPEERELVAAVHPQDGGHPVGVRGRRRRRPRRTSTPAPSPRVTASPGRTSTTAAAPPPTRGSTWSSRGRGCCAAHTRLRCSCSAARLVRVATSRGCATSGASTSANAGRRSPGPPPSSCPGRSSRCRCSRSRRGHRAGHASSTRRHRSSPGTRRGAAPASSSAAPPSWRRARPSSSTTPGGRTPWGRWAART